MTAYRVVDFAEIPGVPCPCGTSRRAFADAAASPAPSTLRTLRRTPALATAAS
jgi:hypothetical protein